MTFYDYRKSLFVLLSGIYVPAEGNCLVLIVLKGWSYFSTLVYPLMLMPGVASMFQGGISKKDLLENLHYMLVLFVVGSMRVVHLIFSKQVNDVLFLIKMEFDSQDEFDELKRIGLGKIERNDRFFSRLMTCWMIGFVVFTPVQGLSSLDDHQPFVSKKLLNLPNYLPFLGESPRDVITGLVILAVGTSVVYLSVVALFESYVSLAILLETLFETLCDSLDRIECRAEAKLKRRECVDLDEATVVCLRENAAQFHKIKRYVEMSLGYLNGVFLIQALLASFTIATAGYMFTQVKLEKGDWMKYISSFLCEGLFTFNICRSAERIKDSCDKVFTNLAWTPWYRYSFQYRKELNIFMLSVKKPMQVRAKPFDFSASREIFYLLMRATINYMSVLKSL